MSGAPQISIPPPIRHHSLPQATRQHYPFELRRAQRIWHSLCAFALAGGIVSGALAQQKTVWQIGQFDDSSGEFRSEGIDYTNPASDPVYRIGVNPSADWPRFQPGPANAVAGGRLHPFRIDFVLAEVPRGVYTLRIAVLYETPRMSHLRVEINGHAGDFYFHPKLDYAAGDWEGTFVPQTSRAEKEIEIPAAWMVKGQNHLTLTAIDTPADKQVSLGNIAPGQSGIIYDALQLSQEPKSALDQRGVRVLAVPTIFYRSAGQGLEEIVDVFVPLPARGADAMPSAITMHIGGRRFVQPLQPAGDFGEQLVEFAIPEWEGERAATLQLGGRSFTTRLTAQKKWTIRIVAHEHLDIGFTDYSEKVAELQSQTIDGVLDTLARHPDFRWTLDGSWVAEQYLKGRSPELQKRFLDQVRAGYIVIPPQYANQHTGVASLEGLIRSLYPSHALASRYSLPLGAANITDVPSYSWSYASVLHSARIKCFAAANNSWRAPILLQGRWNEKSPFYWEGPDGGRVFMWYSRAYLQLTSLFGAPPTIEAVHDALPVFLQAYERPDYVAHSVILFGSQLENTPFSRQQAVLPSAWNAAYAFPRLEFSTFKDAMQTLEGEFGGNAPVVRGDFGPYWEDGYTADSLHTALHRQNQQRILSAEEMGALCSALQPNLRPDLSLLQDAWKNILLFDEHTWTYAGATTQPESEQTIVQLRQKRAEAVRARDDIEQSIERSWGQFESLLAPAHNSLVVFNSLNWTRNGWLEVDLKPSQRIVDATTNQEVKQQVLVREAGVEIPGFGAQPNRVRFLAEAVPAMGYKLFTLADAPPAPPVPATASNVIENKYYRITLDPAGGGIQSIQDKELGWELVDRHSPFLFGAYVYTTGGDDLPHNSLYRYGAALSVPELHPQAAGRGRVVSVVQFAGAAQAILEASALHTPRVQMEITLPEDAKQIDLRYSIHKDAVLSKEAVYIAFPFAGDKPEFTYDTQNGWVNPVRDELAGGSREWYAVNHWAAMNDRGQARGAALIPYDAPMVNFGDIVRGNWPAEFRPPSATIFSWLMSNYWNTNFPSSQGGDFSFRYSVVSGPSTEPAQLTRLGWELLTPLEVNPVAAGAGPALLDANAASFLHLDNPDVVITAWKLAEDGDGSIVRVEEISGKAAAVHMDSAYLRVDQAWRCNALEDCLSSLPAIDGGVDIDLKPFEVATIRMKTTPRHTDK